METLVNFMQGISTKACPSLCNSIGISAIVSDLPGARHIQQMMALPGNGTGIWNWNVPVNNLINLFFYFLHVIPGALAIYMYTVNSKMQFAFAAYCIYATR